jgi:predicted aconitase
MYLTDQERAMLDGKEGPVVAEALDYLIQLGEAFDAERLVDIVYCHYPAEMGIYAGHVEELVRYAQRGGKVRVPTTSTTLCADLERPSSTGIPPALAELQAKVEGAHRSMGVMETYTCTPQQIGFIPPFGSYIASSESSAIIYFNSVIGARTNRGGRFTRYAGITGKYPLMGYLLDENRKGTHHFKVNIPPERLQTIDAWGALGFHIGAIVGSEVPVIEGIKPHRQEWLVSLGAALATSGSVTLYHIPGVTPEARTLEEAFHGKVPTECYEVTERDLDAVYEKLTTVSSETRVDFVDLGCPHSTLEQLRALADMLRGRQIATGVRFWINTNRMTRKQAEYSGYVQAIEAAGALVVADTCPVECHFRQSTCREYGLEVPHVKVMVTDSAKMARYVRDLIGCRTVLTTRERCIEAALNGRWNG